MFLIIVNQRWTDRDIGDMILNLLKNMFRHTLDSACTSIWSYKVQVKLILRVHFRIDCNTLMPRGLFEWLHNTISLITLTCVKWSRLGNPITLMNMQCTACDNILALWSVNVTVIAPVMCLEVARKYFNQTKGQIIITCVIWLEMLPVTYLNCIRNGVSFASRLHKAIEIIYIYIFRPLAHDTEKQRHPLCYHLGLFPLFWITELTLVYAVHSYNIVLMCIWDPLEIHGI